MVGKHSSPKVSVCGRHQPVQPPPTTWLRFSAFRIFTDEQTAGQLQIPRAPLHSSPQLSEGAWHQQVQPPPRTWRRLSAVKIFMVSRDNWSFFFLRTGSLDMVFLHQGGHLLDKSS